MAPPQQPARKQSRRMRDERQKADPGQAQNGHDQEVAEYEKELAGYLQERIKPGLNRGAIPLLARSIAKDLAHRESPNGGSLASESEDASTAEADDEAEDERTAASDDASTAEADDEPEAEDDDDDEPSAEADEDDEPDAEADDDSADFEADMHALQAELGEDWIVRFSVHGDDAWLTAEKDDGSQRVEAPTASVLTEAVELLNERGGRSG